MAEAKELAHWHETPGILITEPARTNWKSETIMRLFADSGAWQALYDRADELHGRAAGAVRGLVGKRTLFYVTDYVFDETVTLIRGRAGHRAATLCGEWLLRSAQVRFVRVTPDIWDESWDLFQRYDDKEFSLTDCSSFVVMRREKLRQVFGFDHNFEQMGFHLWPETE